MPKRPTTGRTVTYRLAEAGVMSLPEEAVVKVKFATDLPIDLLNAVGVYCRSVGVTKTAFAERAFREFLEAEREGR